MSYYIEYFNNADYNSAIEMAAIGGDLEYVNKSIKLASPYSIGNAFENAAKNGKVEVLSFIWENAVLEYYYIKWGLYRAGANGHIEAILKIIELAGSRIEPKEYPDILEAAAFNNHPHVIAKIFEIAKEEISDYEISKAFANAAYRGYIDVVTKLYEIASDKIELDAVKEALRYAAGSGHTEVVLKILEVSGKADIAIAFRNAAINGHVNLITKLIETAGDVITDELCLNAFNDAASKNKLEVMSKIWEVAGSKITTEALNKDFSQAVDNGFTEIVTKIWEVAGSKITTEALNKAFSQAGNKGYTEIAKKIWENASEKIDHKLLLGAISKAAGNPRNAEFVKTIIELVGSKLSKKDFREVFEDLVIKGNFDAATKFQKLVGYQNFTSKINGTNIMVSAILSGLEKSVEPNKYQAFIQLFSKAGIEIPMAHQHKLKEVKDNKNPADFEFINGLAHKLAKYYLASNQPTEWLKIVNAMQNLDNDFALEVVTINGLIPKPFAEDTTVYRGMHLPVTDEELKQFFDYGIRSFSQGGSQKVLGYYVSNSWNDAGKSGWSDGGTYVSTDPRTAAKYAVACVNYNVNQVTTCGGGMSMSESDRKFIFEIQLPKGSPIIFGASVGEFEIVPSYIKGEDIIAIYEVIEKEGLGYETGIPTKVFVNPNAKTTPQLKLNEVIRYEGEKVMGFYNSLESPYGYFRSNGWRSEIVDEAPPYTTHEDFYKKYTSDHYVTDQAKLKETYYSNKPSYTDLGFKDAMVGECNPDYYCC